MAAEDAMNAHELACRILTQPCCTGRSCPFALLQQEAALLSREEVDPVAAISEAVQYTETQSRTMVRVEAHALNRLLDRVTSAERELAAIRQRESGS
jgi:hypothetical protein